MSDTNAHQPTALKGSGTALTIEWSDGVTHTIPWKVLREVCPCATCRDKRNNPPPPEPENDDLLPVISKAEAGPLKANAMRPIGNYAYGIDFSDGHNTGIFSLEFLRAVGEELNEMAAGE